MALTLTTAGSELLDLDSAKTHLRVLDSSLDSEIAALIKAARDDCERDTGRTFRTSTTRALTLCEWWGEDVVLPRPPLLTVSNITYYDADNASQTLSADNYHVELSTDGFGRVVWKSTATIPTIYDRPDAITITFTSGYTADTIPPSVIAAIKLALTDQFERGNEAAVKSARGLLGKHDATSYV